MVANGNHELLLDFYKKETASLYTRHSLTCRNLLPLQLQHNECMFQLLQIKKKTNKKKTIKQWIICNHSWNCWKMLNKQNHFLSQWKIEVSKYYILTVRLQRPSGRSYGTNPPHDKYFIVLFTKHKTLRKRTAAGEDLSWDGRRRL